MKKVTLVLCLLALCASACAVTRVTRSSGSLVVENLEIVEDYIPNTEIPRQLVVFTMTNTSEDLTVIGAGGLLKLYYNTDKGKSFKVLKIDLLDEPLFPGESRDCLAYTSVPYDSGWLYRSVISIKEVKCRRTK